MKITLCDVCLVEDNKLVKASHYYYLSHDKVRVDVCDTHKNFGKDKSESEMKNIAFKSINQKLI